MKATTTTALAMAFLLAANLHAAEPPVRETVVSQGMATIASREGKQSGKAHSVTAEKPISAGQSDRSKRQAASVASESVNQDFWIYDARTDLFDDFDGDGFYTRLELTFDADTVYEGANVYAVVYLSLQGGEWIEYGETSVFDIYGSSAGDEYYYDTDLVSGFPRGYYDVLIELYDDYDQRLVAVFGPSDSADLFDLPLESQNSDGPLPPVIIVSDEGGGGSAGLWLIGGLIVTLLLRLAARRQRFRVAV